MSAEDSLLAPTDATTLARPPAPDGALLDELETSVDGAVLAEEQRRTRMGALRALFIALSLFVAATLLMPNKSALGWVMVAIYAVATGVVGSLLVASRWYSYGSSVSTVIGVTVVLLALGSCVYFGVMGGPIVVLPTVVYYYGLGDSRPRRRWVAGSAIGGHAALIGLAAAGVIPATGMIPADTLVRPDFILMNGVCIATLLLATYWLSHRSRRSTLLAMAALERARKGIRQRDALLDEVRDDLKRAVAGARTGRLTGKVVDGYAVGSVLGRGAMGEVYRVTTEESGSAFALKVLHPHLAESTAQVTRFVREAKIISALNSVHVPRLFASGVEEDGSPYLVMELLDGADLAAMLRARVRLTLGEIDVLVAQTCSALAAAHDAGVVHRDIKPQNLFFAPAPAAGWKVLDFGVSSLADGSGTLTQGGAVGTPAYMAPEQAMGREVDRRADVFSLGAVVYRALTGRPAFTGASSAAVVYSALRYQPLRPSESMKLDVDIDAVLALALAKDPALRFDSARAFAAAWRAARQGALPPEISAAAAALVTAHPWGTDSAMRSGEATA